MNNNIMPIVKIFVSHRYEKKSRAVRDPIYEHIRCGAIFDTEEMPSLVGDDSGDNISEMGKTLNELTVTYWAWKNVKADYYGLCHYRRYFSFSEKYEKEDGWGVVHSPRLDKSAEDRYHLRGRDISSRIAQYDILVPQRVDFKNLGYVLKVAKWELKNACESG